MVNTPSPPSERIPDTCSPDIVRLMAIEPQILLDDWRFPISEDYISDMPSYLTKINTILAAGEAHGISVVHLDQLIAYIKINNTYNMYHATCDERLNQEQRLWLFFYLESRYPDPYMQAFINPSSNLTSVVDAIL
jgi:hypothetical protein